MERDALISHGCPFTLRDRLFLGSDRYSVPVCRKCGMIAIMDDANHTNQCRRCKTLNSNDIVKVEIPYASKLLLKLLGIVKMKVLASLESRFGDFLATLSNCGKLLRTSLPSRHINGIPKTLAFWEYYESVCGRGNTPAYGKNVKGRTIRN